MNVIRRLLTCILELLPEEETEQTAEAAVPDEAAAPVLPAEAGPRCEEVIFSDRAASMIMSRTLVHDPDEVSGIMLGQLKDNVCYVVEATDSGPNAFHSHEHVEMDVKYQNHQSEVVLNLYREDATLLGPWHRHPDNFDRFTLTDLSTIATQAKSIGGWAMAMLVNMDPDLRLSCFFCTLQDDGRLDVRRVPVRVGDQYFKDTGLLDLRYPADFPAPITDAPLCYPIPD